jgi:streptogramin lyase
MRLPLLLLSLPLLLAGCALTSTAPATQPGLSLQGNVRGGQQPINQAHVYLFAANTTGYGSASVSLLSAISTGLSDSVGAYVLTGSDGNFLINGDYSCTAGDQVYLYALGGDPGSGTNHAAGLLAALGNCPIAGNFASAVPFISMNEITTIAAAYSFAGFAIDATHVSSSGAALALTGIANAFANAANLANIATGAALATTPAGNGVVPQTTVDTLANILAACINSSGDITGPSSPTPCYTLVNDAKSSGSSGTMPTDTAAAAINLAHNPTANLTALFDLQTAGSPFAAKLSAVPNDFTLALSFTGAGILTDPNEFFQNEVSNIAVDGSGNVWRANYGSNSLSELSPLGAAHSPSGGYTGGGLNNPTNVAIDLTGRVWTANSGANSLSVFSGSSPVGGSPYTAGGLSGPTNVVIDGSGNAWAVNSSDTLTKLSSSGVAASGSPFSNSLNESFGVAVLPSGKVWVVNPDDDDISVFTAAGGVANSPFTSGGLDLPYGLSFDSNSFGWLANETTISKISSSGTTASGSPYAIPSGAVANSTAIDGNGVVWVAEYGNNTILEMSNSGVLLSGTVGLRAGEATQPESIAVDGSGNVWYTSFNDDTIHELIGAAAPVVTPLAVGVENSHLGTRP